MDGAGRKYSAGSRAGYIPDPDWLKLGDALTRIMATGSSETQGKMGICTLLADGKIRVRVTCVDLSTGAERDTDRAVVPHRLQPNDLYWKQSRPLGPWVIRPTVMQDYSGGGSQRPVPIELLELNSGDLAYHLAAQAAAHAPVAGGVTDDKPLPLPPQRPLWTELPGLLRDIYGLTETQIRDVLLVLRAFPPNFWVSYGPRDDEQIMGWSDWDVVDDDWKAARVRGKGDPAGIDHPLRVPWIEADRAVRSLRVRQEREAARALVTASRTNPDKAPSPPKTTLSGAQGRPTSMHLIALELERRRVAGATLLTQRAEAEALAAWLAKEHPEAPPATGKAINNSLREKLRAAVAEKQNARKEDPK